jgi:hypothetical protein
MELGRVILNSMEGAIRGVQQAGCIAGRNDRRRATASRKPPERSAEAEGDRSLPQQAWSQVERPSETSGASSPAANRPSGERIRPVQGR